MQTSLSPQTHIIQTISMLARAYQFVKTADGQANSELYNGHPALKYDMDKYELDILINHAANRIWWQA